MTQTERFPASIGPWRFSANGVAGQLTLTDDGTGKLSGAIDVDQQVLGFWDAAAQKITGQRPRATSAALSGEHFRPVLRKPAPPGRKTGAFSLHRSSPGLVAPQTACLLPRRGRLS